MAARTTIVLKAGEGTNFVRLGNYEHEVGSLLMGVNVDSGEVSFKNKYTGITEHTSRPWQDFVDLHGTKFTDLKALQGAWKTLNTPR